MANGEIKDLRGSSLQQSIQIAVLRLNPSTLSHAFGQQLLDEGAHLKPVFEQTLLPLISTRLLDPSLQRSIPEASAWAVP